MMVDNQINIETTNNKDNNNGNNNNNNNKEPIPSNNGTNNTDFNTNKTNNDTNKNNTNNQTADDDDAIGENHIDYHDQDSGERSKFLSSLLITEFILLFTILYIYL